MLSLQKLTRCTVLRNKERSRAKSDWPTLSLWWSAKIVWKEKKRTLSWKHVQLCKCACRTGVARTWRKKCGPPWMVHATGWRGPTSKEEPSGKLPRSCDAMHVDQRAKIAHALLCWMSKQQWRPLLSAMTRWRTYRRTCCAHWLLSGCRCMLSPPGGVLHSSFNMKSRTQT